MNEQIYMYVKGGNIIALDVFPVAIQRIHTNTQFYQYIIFSTNVIYSVYRKKK